MRVKDGLTQISGSSGSRGSVIVKAMSVARTARSRSACSGSPGWSGPPASTSRKTTSDSCSSPSGRDSGKPVTQSSRSLRWPSCPVPRPGAIRTASPVTGWPCATSDSGPEVRARGCPPRSVRPTEAPQVSMSTGRRTLPASSTAALLA